MSSTERKILFISHEASLSGAPLVLLNFVRWLRQNKPFIKCDVLLLKGGEYIEAYEQVFDELIFLENRNNHNISNKISSAFKRKLGLQSEDKFLKNISNKNYNLLYCNTVVTLDWGIQIKQILTEARLILHLHELN
ncbi:MAG: hypothetical protein EOO43_20980, partial [Flavobacterium sp.]